MECDMSHTPILDVNLPVIFCRLLEKCPPIDPPTTTIKRGPRHCLEEVDIPRIEVMSGFRIQVIVQTLWKDGDSWFQNPGLGNLFWGMKNWWSQASGLDTSNDTGFHESRTIVFNEDEPREHHQAPHYYWNEKQKHPWAVMCSIAHSHENNPHHTKSRF